MDANEMCDTIMLELNNQVTTDTDETKEQQESFLFYEDTESDYIPPSLLSYFETSKSRAAVCEKLILEELEDLTASHHTEDMMNLPFELNEDLMKQNELVICDRENEENNTSTDTRLLPAPTEALFTHNVSVCPNNEDEYKESEKHLAFEYEAEQEKQHCEEIKREEQKRQTERDFQKELKKIIETEKLHQKELELMGKRAQEKLEQELLLQQELITNLQRRVEEERMRWEDEQKRMKDKEDKRRREKEKKKIEAERKRIEEEMRRKKEEEREIEEMKLQEEERNHEEKRRMEREEKKKREEDRKKMDLEKKKLEDELKMMEEEGRKMKEEERKKTEEARKKMEKEARKIEEEMSLKKKEEEEREKREEENMRIEEERRITEECEERTKQEEVRKNQEVEKADDRKEMALKKMYDEMRKRDKQVENVKVDEEIKLEEGKKTENRKVKEMVRKKEGENQKNKYLQPIEADEKGKEEEGMKSEEEERRRKQRDEEDYRKSEEEIKLKEDKEGYKGYDVYNRKMKHERKTQDEEKKQEMRKREKERNNIEAGKETKEEEVREKVNKNTEEEKTLKEREESKKRVVQGREKEARRANELQEKRGNHSRNIDETEKSLVSQLKDSTTWTSSSPDPLHSESTNSPTSTESIPPKHDPNENISQTSIEKTVDCENQAAKPSTMSAILPVCLPEHTERKRLAWMKDCVPWSKLSLQNRRKQKGSVWSRRWLRGAGEASALPPLCPDRLLQSTGWKSLQEVTIVTLEDLPGCSLASVAECTHLQSLTLRRCGLRSLQGINQLAHLCYIDVQENDISFVDCENMTSLRVLRLSHNKLTSIHGLTGAENVDVLDLSHNSITRIAGLESMRSLQRLSVDHNQLISTKGLRDVYTLLHLNCSHNHLASVEGLENSALLITLDLRANSLTEPPSLNNQVLLQELHLDDNSISSLQGLTACWLPLMQHLSVAQNRITQLPSMSHSVSLTNLDVRFNCMSELQNVCESLDGCVFLRKVHLTGNPLQQESGWRSTLQKAVPGLMVIDDQETDSFLTPPAVQQVSLASGSFRLFCQAQLQQTHDLQQQHSSELSNASSSLDAVKTSCRHFTEALQLAMDQRLAHEYGDTTVADKNSAAGQTTPEETLDMDSANAEESTERPETESTGNVPPVVPNRDRCNYWTLEAKSAERETRHDTLNTGPKMGPTVREENSGSVPSSRKGKISPSNLEMEPASNYEDLHLQKSTAAAVIQQLWRKYRQKCGNISSLSTAEKGGGRGGDGGKPESGPSYINGSVVGQDYAATVIQAFWRGFSLRRRLASALAAVTCPDTGENDIFEEVDVDEFVFDEAVLKKHWTFSLTDDSPPRHYPVSEQPLSPKPPGLFPEPSQDILPPPLVWRPKQAWVPGKQVDSVGQRVSPESSNRSKSSASASVLNGLSERSEKILEEWGFTNSRTAFLMLKRAQKMKSAKQQQKKQPFIPVAFRNCSHQLGPVEARNKPAQHKRKDMKDREAELGLQQGEKVERVKQERAQQWLHTQVAPSDRDSESVHFLPEISNKIRDGGRVLLVADPGYTERLHHARLWANNSSAAQPCKWNSYPRRNSLGHAREEVPSPRRVTCDPSKKERISYRDNPVQLSGGWGGGRKRDKVYK